MLVEHTSPKSTPVRNDFSPWIYLCSAVALPPLLRTKPFGPTNNLHRFPPSAETPIPVRVRRPNSPMFAIPGKPSETNQSSLQTPDPSPPDQTAAPHLS